MLDYCEAYKSWLQSDRKRPPDCKRCAEAQSLRARADAGVQKAAERAARMRERADLILASEVHGG